MKYRAEIDGLRALALLPVILFHGGFERFSGGYIGVDVFFVISGYLITTIIISDISEGKFSIINFYERRARRILPALFFVMLICLPFAWFLLTPSDLKDFGQSYIAVSTFSSNILFWWEKDYFSNASELTPLLHTWSLAVEEQYYIFFPLFLIIFWKFGIKWVLILLAIIFLISLSIAICGTQYSTRPKIISGSFFLLPTRGWELLIGVFAGFYLKYKTHFKSYFANQILSLLGFGMIVYSIYFFDKTTPFPSLYSLVPTIGTLLLILCAVPNTFMHKFLSLKIIVGIGLISYSTYLWHQPLLAFSRQYFLGITLPTHLVFALCIGSLFLGWFNWYFIEKPFRKKNNIKKENIFIFSSLAICIFIVIGLLFHIKDGYDDRIPNEFKESFNKKELKICNFNFLSKNFKSDNFNKCMLLADVFLVGDSHAAALSYSLANELKLINKKLITITHEGCLPLPGVIGLKSPQSCSDYINFLHKRVFVNNNFVVLSARWRFYIEGTRYDNGEGGVEPGGNFRLSLINKDEHSDIVSYLKNRVKQINKKVKLVIINQIPEVGINVPNWYSRTKKILTHSYKEYLMQNNLVNNIFNNIDGLKIINSDELVCNRETLRCSTKIGSNLLYFDDDHPSLFYAQLISKKIILQNF